MSDKNELSPRPPLRPREYLPILAMIGVIGLPVYLLGYGHPPRPKKPFSNKEKQRLPHKKNLPTAAADIGAATLRAIAGVEDGVEIGPDRNHKNGVRIKIVSANDIEAYRLTVAMEEQNGYLESKTTYSVVADENFIDINGNAHGAIYRRPNKPLGPKPAWSGTFSSGPNDALGYRYAAAPLSKKNRQQGFSYNPSGVSTGTENIARAVLAKIASPGI